MATSVPSDPLYTHPCTLPHRTLWFGRVSLYEDRICIRGWTWRGRYRRTVGLSDVAEFEWRPRPEKPNLMLALNDGRVVWLRLEEGGGLWNAKLHELLGEPLLNRHSLSANGHSTEEVSQEVP